MMDSTGLSTIDPLFGSKYSWGFIIIIIITMSFAQTGLDNIALHKQKGNVLTLDL
jgi:hypothetical protein